MDSPVLSLITSFIALTLIAVSYFVKKKELYLFYQLSGIVFLTLSYFFGLQFSAMVGLGISVIRSLTYFLCERKDKTAPLYFAFVFSLVTIASYFIVNIWILKKAELIDILLLVACCLYAFIFRIRDLKTVRFTMLVPTILSVFYNAFSGAALFVTLSYAFELTANVVSIFKYHIIGVHKDYTKETPKENEYETN